MSIQLSTIKLALKIDYSTDDAELIRIRDSVIDWIEVYTGVSLSVQDQTDYAWWWMRKRLNSDPFIAIDTVQYYDSTNTLTTMPATDYFLDRSNPPSIYINFSEYPAVYENTQILINYTTGYGQIPAHIQQAAIALIGHWYNNPESAAPVTLQEVPMSARFILDNIRTKNAVLE
jgi:uncharacterized phiE125 gp8 family phage protein